MDYGGLFHCFEIVIILILILVLDMRLPFSGCYHSRPVDEEILVATRENFVLPTTFRVVLRVT